jgi:hypothetical protein
VFDGGDGLPTSACGTLAAMGKSGTGTTGSTSEAQNWQFAGKKDRTYMVAIQNEGVMCAKIIILDANGKLIDNFDNPAQIFNAELFNDKTSQSIMTFQSDADRTYIVRLTTPKTPCTYWLKIIG